MEQQSFVFNLNWKGGISYLTYLTKITRVNMQENEINIEETNKVLGIIPTGKKAKSIAITDITQLSVGTKINWFQFIIATIMSVLIFNLVALGSGLKWVALLIAIFLYWLSFRSKCVSLTDRLGLKHKLITNSSTEAESFIAGFVNIRDKVNSQPIIIKREAKTKVIVLSCLAGVIVIGSTVWSLFAYENKTAINWVKNAQLVGTTQTMADILENPDYFKNVTWSNVTYEGASDLDKYVMYEGTYYEPGVSIFIRTVFEVYGEAQFSVVETLVDGYEQDINNWDEFIFEMSARLDGTSAIFDSIEEAGEVVEETAVEESVSSTNESELSTPLVSTQVGINFNLDQFEMWSPNETPLFITGNFDGESLTTTIQWDNPIGTVVSVINDNTSEFWDLELPIETFSGEPFDENLDLYEGFSFYVTLHDFNEDGVEEIVIAASDRLLETYVWIYGYNFIYSEYDMSPFSSLWSGEGQSNLQLEKNTVILPYGSQGLFSEYTYINDQFVQTN